MINPIHEHWLRRFRENLRADRTDQLEASLNEAGLELLLDPEFLALARQMNARQLVVMLATIGAANGQDPSPHERLLAAYQCLLGQLPVDEAAKRCASAVQGSTAFYRVLLESLDHNATAPQVAGLNARANDLRFGIELLADAHRSAVITPLLQAWQRIDRSDMPWLRTCRILVSRAEAMTTASEAAQLALAIQERLHDAPRGQDAVKQEMRIQLADVALKCRQGDLALKAAEEAYAHESLPEHRFIVARALMVNGELGKALEHVDALVRELATHPDAKLRPENKTLYSFDVAAAEDTLVTVNRLLRAEGLCPFLMSGTLLGYAREGALLAHDKDIDVGLLGWEAQFTVAKALFRTGHFHLDLTHLTGKNRFLVTAHDLRNGMAVDFFFFHDRGDHFLHGIDSAIGFTQNFRFSKFELRDIEFLGETFSVPDNVDTNLKENYGDWKVPAPSYVVTVESPALCDDNPLSRQLWVNLELLRTITQGFKPQRAQRVLDHVQARGLPYISAPARVAVQNWIKDRGNHSMAEAA